MKIQMCSIFNYAMLILGGNFKSILGSGPEYILGFLKIDA